MYKTPYSTRKYELLGSHNYENRCKKPPKQLSLLKNKIIGIRHAVRFQISPPGVWIGARGSIWIPTQGCHSGSEFSFTGQMETLNVRQSASEKSEATHWVPYWGTLFCHITEYRKNYFMQEYLCRSVSCTSV